MCEKPWMPRAYGSQDRGLPRPQHGPQPTRHLGKSARRDAEIACLGCAEAAGVNTGAGGGT